MPRIERQNSQGPAPNIIHLFSRLKKAGIKLVVEGDHLKINLLGGDLDPSLLGELKERKKDIVEFMKHQHGGRTRDERIDPVEKKDYYRLSSAQARLYILQALDMKMPVMTLFRFPTIRSLAAHLEAGLSGEKPLSAGKESFEQNRKPVVGRKDIAVIGMAGRFPGAGDISRFWENLTQGKESISFFTAEELSESGVEPQFLKDPHYVMANGRLNAAAGAAGFIKAALCLFHRQIPPSLHFNTPNPKIDFENSPFYVNTTLKEWQTGGFPRRASVSSFGMGGTNAHIILEESPHHNKGEEPLTPKGDAFVRPPLVGEAFLLPLSARSAGSNRTGIGRVRDYRARQLPAEVFFHHFRQL